LFEVIAPQKGCGMFDDPISLRSAAHRYRLIASHTDSEDAVHLFTAVADAYDLRAASFRRACLVHKQYYTGRSFQVIPKCSA
jgi:hypothetical protein